MLTNSPATLRMINESQLQRHPSPATAKRRPAWRDRDWEDVSAPFNLLQQTLLQSQDTSLHGILRSAKGQWIPVFAYSCQLLLCCTAVLSPSGSTSITTAQTEAAMIQWGQCHIQNMPSDGKY